MTRIRILEPDRQSSPEGGRVARRRSGVRRDVLHANSGRLYAAVCSAQGGGQSRCLSSTFSPTTGNCSRRGRVAEATPASLATSNAVAFDSALVYGPNSTSAFRADPPPPTAPPNSFSMRQT
jgi:hypothetical protein